MAEPDEYPGAEATPEQIRQLADAYRQAAILLRANLRKEVPLSRAPFRLTAVHAIELYLNAWLRHSGHCACSIRGLQHDMAQRVTLAVAAGLNLKAKRRAHIEAIGANRDYLVTRYAPDRIAPDPETRLVATLDEVAGKVTRLLEMPTRPPKTTVPVA